jgi:iron complex outermembrane receptor protein
MAHFRTKLILGVSFAALTAPLRAQQADPGAASAQTVEEAQPVDEAKKDPAVKDEDVIIVTADRRQQTLQDYAGTAATFSGEQLKKRGIQNISDLNDVLPGLTVANNGINREVWIRGIGSSNNTELGDPAAATHWDGVYLPRPSGIGSAFFDIERVEVNVGPQGTLRGRNATAGSVNVITWKPGLGVWDAELEGEYGNYDQKVVRGMINVPIGDTAALRFSGMGLSHDSYYKNVGPNRDVGVAEAEDNVAGRLQFLFKPNDKFRVLIAGDYMHETGSGWTGTNYANPLGNGIDPDDIEDPRKVIGRAFTPDLDIKHRGIRGEIGYDLGFASLDYVGSYRRVTSDYQAATPIAPYYDGVYANLSRREDATTGDPSDFVNPAIVLGEVIDNWSRFESYNDSKSHYHELRLHQDKGKLVWSFGTNFFKEDQYAFLGATGDRSPYFSGIEFNMPDVNAKSYGVFGDATYSVTPKARITAGLRFTDDRKSREGVAARYSFVLGDGNFNCCLGVRVGTEGFQFAIKDRTIFNPDANGDGTVSHAEGLAFYFNGVAQFGSRDNVDDIFANGEILGHYGTVPGVPTCVDTVTGDFLTCNGFEPSGQFTYGFLGEGTIFRQSGRMHQKFVDWRLRGEYDITDDNLVYGLVTTGHKSGGFNDNLGDFGVAPTYRPEKVTLFELGSKNVFYLGGVRTKLNGSLFYNKYRDQVLTSILSVAQVIDLTDLPLAQLPPGTEQNLVVSFSYNAANSHIKGINLEGGFDLPANINFDWNMLYLDAKVDKAEPIEDFRYQRDVEAAGAVFRSIDGKRLPRTAKYQMNASLSQTFDVGTGKLDYIVSAGYRSAQYMTIFNGEDFTPATPERRLDDRVGGYWTFDLGAGYSHGPDAKLRIEGYVNNVTNAIHESAIIITQFDNTRFFTRPRTFGARVRVRM